MRTQETIGGAAESGGPIAKGTGRRRNLGAAMAALAATVAVAGLVNVSPAGAAVPPGYRDVVSKRNSMCLDVAHASSQPGAPVVQGTCWGGYNQKWALEYVDTDWWTKVSYYRLRVLHSRQCLDVEGNSSNDGARLTQWDCHPGHNQQFRRLNVADNLFRLEARHSGKCVTADNSTLHAAQVRQVSCTNATTQHWSLR